MQDLETKWREAYQTQENNLKGETKLSTIGIKGAETLSKSDVGREYKNLYKNQEIAKNIFENSKKDLENINIITKRNTGWFKTKYGDRGTLISDKNAKLTKKLETNKTYRLGDIFEHDLLYKAYPKLKRLKLKTYDFGKNHRTAYGAYNKSLLSEQIYLNNFWVENLGDFKGTLLHEINHYIQAKEKFDKRSRGAKIGEQNRNSNLGEIISHEAKIYSEFTQEELNDIILPELAKNNPRYENIKNLILERNNADFRSKLEKGESKGIYDYETNEYVGTNENQNRNKKTPQAAEKRKVVRSDGRRLKYDSELDNSSFSLKQKQLNIILKNNPVNDDYHTWIRTIEDIKTFEETLQDSDYKEYYESTGTRTNFSDIRQKNSANEVSKAIEPVINDIKTISEELKHYKEITIEQINDAIKSSLNLQIMSFYSKINKKEDNHDLPKIYKRTRNNRSNCSLKRNNR